jgi:DnaJ family protein A protein 2
MTEKSKPDLYGIIGVSKTATEDEIKKAYKKKAIKLHPDRNPNNQEEANRQFQELNHAVKILTNPESRRRYDQFGIIDGDGEQPGGMNPFDIFENIFNSMGGGGGGMGGGGIPGFFSNMGGMGGMGGAGGNRGNKSDSPRVGKSPDKKITVNLSLADVYVGKQVPLDFVKMVCCDTCQGRGAKNAEAVITCTLCNGQGRIVKMMQMGPMIQQIVQPCGSCAGKGKIIKPGNECGICHGKKAVGIKRHLDCYIRPGAKPGDVITFKNESDWHPEFTDVGDLLVFVNSKNEDAGFQREGDNLLMKRSISLLEALTGTVIFFKHLDERVIKIAYENIIYPNQKMVIKGEGMPNLQDTLVKGDLIIVFDVQFPQTLDKERARYLIKILPTPKKQIWDMQLEQTPENELTFHTMEPFQNTDNFTSARTYNHRQNGDTTGTTNDIDSSEYDDTNSGGFNMPAPVECTTQ